MKKINLGKVFPTLTNGIRQARVFINDDTNYKSSSPVGIITSDKRDREKSVYSFFKKDIYSAKPIRVSKSLTYIKNAILEDAVKASKKSKDISVDISATLTSDVPAS